MARKNRRLINAKLHDQNDVAMIYASLVEMPIICKPIFRPAVPNHILNNRNLRNLQLADRYNQAEEKEIHMLIGLDYYYHFITGRIKRGSQQPIAIETVCGWMLITDSQNETVTPRPSITTMFITTEVEKSLNEDLKRFWEIEEGVVQKPVCSANKEAIRKFHENVKYDPEEKKYTVRLPFVDNEKNIASNYKNAEAQLTSLMGKLKADPTLQKNYCESMSAYLNEGYAEPVPENELSSDDVYYMPHRAVIKEESSTTKTRIVFNASSCLKNQASLNDKLLIGPTLHPSIVEIILKWRYKSVGVVADIKKMYSMIEVAETDRNWLRFLWLEDGRIKQFRHKVLAFGIRSAPFLAIETVQSHIRKFAAEYPEVTESLLESTYVDDYCDSQETSIAAKATVSVASEIMAKAGMELRKWQSNNREVMEHCKTLSCSTDITSNERKVLGIHWNTSQDYLFYQPPQYSCSGKYISKRIIIGTIAQLHDPIGFISPVIVQAKLIVQKLWAAGVEWDENLLGTSIATEWFNWYRNLEGIKEIRIRRQYVPENIVAKKTEVHIFCDASEKGYATAAYLCMEDESGVRYTALLTSKTKVAPLKMITLPRQELLAALIGSRLSLVIKRALKVDLEIYFWSDSTITLHWIKNVEVRWKTFVENRVQEIREHTDPVQWRYCPGKENPADIASRGASPDQLKLSLVWWEGPPWLKKEECSWPQKISPQVAPFEAIKERRIAKYNTCLVTSATKIIDPTQYKLSRLLLKTAYIRRFYNNCKKKKEGEPLLLNKYPTAEEISEALSCWLTLVQNEYYPEERERLGMKQHLKRDSKIIQLTPFLEEETGLIKMQGRLQNAKLTESEKHPIILPHQSPFVKSLVEHIHCQQLHAGINQTLIALRNNYWITRARSLVKSIVKSCLICRMFMPKRLTVPFSPLPVDRVSESEPFNIVGTDFTGPVYIEETKNTVKRTTHICPVQIVKVTSTSKAYILLFTCAITRAVHLEMVPDLTVDAFIRAFRRFVSRRTTPAIIYSDNAKTFKSAEKEIRECYTMLNSPKFQEFISEQLIQWKYICPISPWWGGYWERLMKTIKIPLRKVLGKSFLSADEMYTVLTEVEAMVNSRPLCAVNDEPDCQNYLTPANFLTGKPLINLPLHPLHGKEAYTTASRKQLNILMMNQEKSLRSIWKMWREEYIRSLGVCPDIRNNVPIKENDLVMVSDNSTPRCTWSIGRIAELIQGRDGRIRSVIVKNKGKLRTRPIQMISQLEVSDQADEVVVMKRQTTGGEYVED